MRCYLVQGGGCVRYASTQRDARVVRDEIAKETGSAAKALTVEEVEIPMVKAELLAFINGLCANNDEHRMD